MPHVFKKHFRCVICIILSCKNVTSNEFDTPLKPAAVVVDVVVVDVVEVEVLTDVVVVADVVVGVVVVVKY